MKVFILLCIYLATASADELFNIPVHKIGLPEGEGQALLVRCPGKSIVVKITGAKAGQLPAVELQNSDDCLTKLLTPNTLDRSEGKTTYRALELPTEFKTPVIGDLIVMVPPNQSKFAIVITRTY
jgi:hypothetical protein